MSADLPTRETVVVAAMALNLVVLVASALWAWRGGYLTGLDDRSTNLHPEPAPKETTHG
jgi:hypothetical protein